ncbi:MAG: flagellar export chaperone FliS [Selenomonadaceae bacterium]|nr:flagellar export chaperone FliS [Selenomonadaceae bacterium]MBQ6130816.1 flagellar export chaperone FliS [Selenomonadaceae bacterium]MBQ7493092.1 flagellar export chaperone FliS [Selenomonadaceae bacterium]
MVNAAEAYRQNRILNAPPEHLTLMLYNGCIKFIEDGRDALEKKEYEEANTLLQKAQRIISEFRLTLNFDYEIAHQLLPLYNYIYDRLVEGNIQSDLAKIDEAKGIVVELRDAWVEAMKKARIEKGEGTGGKGYA